MKKPNTHFVASVTRLLQLVFISIGEAATIQPSSGQFGVNMGAAKLIDTSRKDPYASSTQDREVMVSLFYPSGSSKKCNSKLVPYMPPATAALQDQYYSDFGIPSGTFASLKLSMCTTPANQRVQDYPLVIFSPGLGNSRHLYNGMAQSVASFGYNVATIDHPYDAEFVEFPNGTVVFAANITTDEQIVSAVETRAKDVKFVLNELSKKSVVQQLAPTIHSSLNTNKVAMFGHSLGGATAASAMMNDPRILGGVNLDGTFFGPVIQRGVRNPFLIVGHEGKNQTTDATWASIWPRLGKKKLELMVNGAQHGSFLDLPLLLQTLGLTDQLPAEVFELVGTLSGTRARQIVTKYLVAFFESVLGCGIVPLLQKESKDYPEVIFVNGSMGNGLKGRVY